MLRTSGLAAVVAAGAAVAAVVVGWVATGCTGAQAAITLNASTVKTRHITKERLLILPLLFYSLCIEICHRLVLRWQLNRFISFLIDNPNKGRTKDLTSFYRGRATRSIRAIVTDAVSKKYGSKPVRARCCGFI